MAVVSYIFITTVLNFAIFWHSSEAAVVKHFENHASMSVKPKVLLLSIGGLRGEYFTDINLTYIEQMIKHGTKAKYVQNAVNVVDIVDHYSIVTGLYPESHGIISNTMYDPTLNRVFNSKTHADSYWWVNVNPIWKEIEDQGKGLSAVCDWPGVYGPMKSSLNCSQRKSFKSDIDQALEWLHNGVQLVLLYSDDIKKSAIKFGPFSQETINEVRKLDSIVKYLLNKTRDLNVNILLTSDSGVAELNNYHIDLDRCLDPKSYVLTQLQGTLLFYPKRGYTVQELYNNLTKCEHVKVFRKDELPERFHFSKNDRIPPLIAFVPLGAVVRSSKPAYQSMTGYTKGGTGYHPGYEVMRGVFIGYGPSFQPGLKFQAIKNVDIYGLLCHILGITPRPNNGSYHVVNSMFNDMTSFAVDVNSDVTPAVVKDTKVNTTDVPPQPITERIHIASDVKALFWILVAVTALLMLVCFVGCFKTMYDNYKRGHIHKTKVHGPGEKRLLAASSSDEE